MMEEMSELIRMRSLLRRLKSRTILKTCARVRMCVCVRARVCGYIYREGGRASERASERERERRERERVDQDAHPR